jgi:hypothetical protein
MKRIWAPQVIVCGMLLWAINSANPYGYYIFLRYISYGVFAFLSYRFYFDGKSGWTWVFVAFAVIFNPFLPANLGRQIWLIMDIIGAGLVIASIFLLNSKAKDIES